MTSTTRDTVPEKLQEAIAESEPPSIAKEPYVQGDKFNTNYLTEWHNNGSCMAFMEPGKKGVLAIELPTCTAIASKALLNRPDKTTQTTLTNIKTQNNESKKKYNVLQRKQQSTNTMVTISTSREYASNITNNIVQQQYSPP